MSGYLVSYMAAWPPQNTGGSTRFPFWRTMLCCASALVLLLVSIGCTPGTVREQPPTYVLEVQVLPDGGVYLAPRDYLRLRRHMGVD